MKTVRIGLAWASAVITMLASVVGLWHVAHEVAKMPELAAAAVVAGFDISAITAGLKVVERPRHVPNWLLLIGLAAISAGAQILAAPVELGWWRLLHGAPPVTAIWTLHGAVGDGPAKGKKKTNKKQDRAPRNDAAGATSRSAAPPLPPAAEVQDAEINLAPVADLGARRKEGRRPTETGAPPLSVEDEQRVQRAARLLLGEGARKATRRDIERVLDVGNRVAGRLLAAVNEEMADGQTMTAGADND